MKLQAQRNKKEFDRFKKYSKQFPKRMNDFMMLVNLDMADQARQEIARAIPDPEFARYIDSLKPVLVAGSTEAALVSMENKSKVGDLDETTDVCFFVQDGKGNSAYGDYLIEQSPFVLGFVKLAPKGISMVTRRVTRDERAEVLEQNIEKRDELTDMQFECKDHLIKITESYIDVLFVLRRLEFGIPGMPNRPHWRRVAGNINKYAANALKKYSLFDDKSLPKPVAESISKEQELELADFQEVFN